ncbi:hypothetical protein FLAVO9AF_100094 [Flavobacterium sp. 9AF]|nr:hypothetical protein FLAVO9AF_100094 [Flavobacterium sp. 9AF]
MQQAQAVKKMTWSRISRKLGEFSKISLYLLWLDYDSYLYL